MSNFIELSQIITIMRFPLLQDIFTILDYPLSDTCIIDNSILSPCATIYLTNHHLYGSQTSFYHRNVFLLKGSTVSGKAIPIIEISASQLESNKDIEISLHMNSSIDVDYPISQTFIINDYRVGLNCYDIKRDEDIYIMFLYFCIDENLVSLRKKEINEMIREMEERNIEDPRVKIAEGYYNKKLMRNTMKERMNSYVRRILLCFKVMNKMRINNKIPRFIVYSIIKELILVNTISSLSCNNKTAIITSRKRKIEEDYN